MGAGEARREYARGTSPSGDGPRPEEALRGVLPPRGDMAAHRLPLAGGADRCSLEGSRGGPEEAGAEKSAGGETRPDEGHLGDEERRRRAGGPGLGTAAGVKEGMHPSASGGGEGQESAAASAKSASPARASGAGGDAIQPAPSTTPVILTSAQLVKGLKKEGGGESPAWKAAAVHPARRADDASASSTPLKETPENGATL